MFSLRERVCTASEGIPSRAVHRKQYDVRLVLDMLVRIAPPCSFPGPRLEHWIAHTALARFACFVSLCGKHVSGEILCANRRHCSFSLLRWRRKAHN